MSSGREPRTLRTLETKCTEPVTSSSGNSTDLRRSGCHSENHQPWTLRTRCKHDSMDPRRLGQAPSEPNLAQIATTALFTVPVPVSVSIRRRGAHSRTVCLRRVQRKCTESVESSSDNPTDLRRSDCHSESHQPQTLRARCKPHTRGSPSRRQGTPKQTCRKLRSFLFAQSATAHERTCSGAFRGRKTAGHEGPAANIRRAGNAFVHLPDEPSASA